MHISRSSGTKDTADTDNQQHQNTTKGKTVHLHPQSGVTTTAVADIEVAPPPPALPTTAARSCRSTTTSRIVPWEERYSQLVNYQRLNGHCNVPQQTQHDSLARWVNHQRETYKKNSLSTERFDLLEQIGFQFSRHSSWEDRYKELCQYHRLKGHANVPYGCEENPVLARWCSKQRGHRRRNKLSKEKIRQLNDIGFDWNVQRAVQSTTRRKSKPTGNDTRGPCIVAYGNPLHEIDTISTASVTVGREHIGDASDVAGEGIYTHYSVGALGDTSHDAGEEEEPSPPNYAEI